MKYVHLGTAILVGLWSAGCASTPAPHDKVASAQAALQSAEEIGAREVPRASLHLQLAQDELERGKALIRNGDNQEARNMLLRAQADAELALGLARESKTRVAAQEAKARAQALRSGAAPGSAIGGGPGGRPPPPVVPPSPSTPAPHGAPSPHPAPRGTPSPQGTPAPTMRPAPPAPPVLPPPPPLHP